MFFGEHWKEKQAKYLSLILVTCDQVSPIVPNGAYLYIKDNNILYYIAQRQQYIYII